MIDKLEAAERLIVSGASMSLEGLDPLAIHVVASSALNTLRDLIQHGGDDYVAKLLRLGLFEVASARVAGEELKLPVPQENEELIEKVMAAVAAGHIKCADDIKINLTGKQCREMLDYVYTPYNFLKHADRDPLATLDETDIDAVGTLAHAITAYSMLRAEGELPEIVGAFLSKNGLT